MPHARRLHPAVLVLLSINPQVIAQALTNAPLDEAPSTAAAFAFDPLRRITYGLDLRDGQPRFWEWDGQRFARRTMAGVPIANRMAFDEHRRVLVAFGQTGIHEFDGTNWRSVAMVMPGDQGCYDAVRRCIVSVDPYGVHEWNGAQLRSSPLGALPARDDAALAWHPGQQRVLLYGGWSAQPLDDLWSYDGSTWTLQQANAAPGPRRGARFAFDPTGNRLVLHGGQGAATPTTWQLQGNVWSQIPGTPPSFPAQPSFAAPAGQLAADDTGVLLADTDNDAIWQLAGNTWRAVGRPAPARNVAVAWDPVRQQVVLFGGQVGTVPAPGAPANGTWTRGNTWQRHSPVTSPPPRTRAGMAWSTVNSAVLLFGGSDLNGLLADTWLWNGSSWTQQITGAGPTARQQPTIVAEPGGGVLLLGGFDPVLLQTLQEVWRWDGTAWSMLTRPAGMDLTISSGAFDPMRNVTVISDAGATWEWNGATWQLAGAPLQFAPPCTFDPVRQCVVTRGPTLQRWNGSTWSQLATVGWFNESLPIGDPARGQLLEFDRANANLRLWTATPHTLGPQGTGCAIGAPPALHATGQPRLGAPDFAMQAVGHTPAALVALELGLQFAPTPLGGGCNRYVTAAFAALAVADGMGEVTFAIPIPDDPLLLGFDVWAQAIAYDPSRSPGAGLVSSNAMNVTVGE